MFRGAVGNIRLAEETGDELPSNQGGTRCESKLDELNKLMTRLLKEIKAGSCGRFSNNRYRRVVFKIILRKIVNVDHEMKSKLPVKPKMSSRETRDGRPIAARIDRRRSRKSSKEQGRSKSLRGSALSDRVHNLVPRARDLPLKIADSGYEIAGFIAAHPVQFTGADVTILSNRVYNELRIG